MRLKTGKREITCLLTKVINKYEEASGRPVSRNSNRKNYEEVARKLSEISNDLPNTAVSLQHDPYSPDVNPRKLEYPFRKYDITGNQVKDAFFNQIVAHPRSFLVDACYIYLYNKGRKGFEKDPVDPDLLEDETKASTNDPSIFEEDIRNLKQQLASQEEESNAALYRMGVLAKKQRRKWLLMASLVTVLLAVSLAGWIVTRNQWTTVKKEMNILPYQPTKAEIDSLEGVWVCYTGSPQARSSDANRYHMVVSNVLNVSYHNGYFTFLRYGASFDHIGYMQFESPWLVSIHSYAKNGDSINSPRHSLMQLNDVSPIPVISASWNFDVSSHNSIIGIREVYIKKGKGGQTEEVINTIDNAGCRCKIIKWQLPNQTDTKVFYLKNESLDSLPDIKLRSMIDESSILERAPGEGLVYKRDTTRH